jgi:hypothetical protein
LESLDEDEAVGVCNDEAEEVHREASQVARDRGAVKALDNVLDKLRKQVRG